MKTVTFRYSILCAALALPLMTVQANDMFDELEAATSTPSPSNKANTPSTRDQFEEYKRQQKEIFEDYKKKLQQEFAEYKAIAMEEQARFDKELTKVWDKPETSTNKVWVDYSNDLKTKNKVDFEKKTITISTTVPKNKSVDDAEIKQKLKQLITKNKAEAFRDDKVAQAVEKRSTEKLELVKTAKVEADPILIPLVSDEEKPSEAEVETIVTTMLEKKSTKVETNKQGEKVVTVEVPISEPKEPKVMADIRVNQLPRAARKVSKYVDKYSSKAKVDAALVFAVIETESAFNPMAKSPIPAYGLMQIVPSSAGMDATQRLFGEGKLLSPSYLYTSHKNIEVGSTYLNILYYSYLKAIKDPKSRLYCAIAAYNTGAGNVAKAFTGSLNLRKAVPKINAMTPEQVYDHLIKNLPYEETRNYLRKVVTRIPKYSV